MASPTQSRARAQSPTRAKSPGRPQSPARPPSPALAAPATRAARPDFAAVQSARPPWDSSASFHLTQPPSPSWTFGSGATDAGASLSIPQLCIDPYAPGRPVQSNYSLLLSGIAPRPVGLLSTLSADGARANLAPFSYVQIVSHDPPLFMVSFVAGKKDTLRNLQATGECVMSLVSEHFVEAANATAVGAPWGEEEWALSGLTKAQSEVVRPARVGEAVFSIEGKLESVREVMSRERPGEVSATVVMVEGVRFWVREDAVDAEGAVIDPAVLRPMSRVGGIMYSRATGGVEIARPRWEAEGLVTAKSDGQ